MLHCGVPPRAFRRKRITSDTVEMRAVINRALEAESLGTSPETTNSVTCISRETPKLLFLRSLRIGVRVAIPTLPRTDSRPHLTGRNPMEGEASGLPQILAIISDTPTELPPRHDRAEALRTPLSNSFAIVRSFCKSSLPVPR